MSESDRQVSQLERWVKTAICATPLFGEAWGLPESNPHLRTIRDDFLLANLRPEMTILEIGAGGGRWSQYFVGKVAKAILVDASWASEAAIRSRFDWPGFEFARSPDGKLPGIPAASIDFAFSFDTFVHFERELFDQYLAELGRVVKPGGKLALHYARRWPECEHNGECFKYREPAEVEGMLGAAGMALTGREMELLSGYGSIIVESIRL